MGFTEVGGDDAPIEVVIRVQVCLTQGTARVQNVLMPSPGQGTPLRLSNALAPSLGDGIRAWLNDLDARGRTGGTKAQYEEQINRVARDQGWESVADVSYESAVAWLADRRRGGWGGATYKRAATTLRSFGRSLSKAKLTSGNVLEHIESSGIVSGDGSRPLEVWEAQAIVRAARESERASRRCRGTPALFWTFLFLSGFRYTEARECLWRQVDLDTEDPCLWSNPQATKNKMRMPVGLCPELGAMLRAHRDKMLTYSEDRRVFEMAPNRESWHATREAAGVDAKDRHGSPATPHSCRKSFHVWLGAAGVPETVVEAMMRHVDSVGRKSYNRPFIKTLSEAAARLPILNEKSPGFVTCTPPGNRLSSCIARQSSLVQGLEVMMTTPTHNTTVEGLAPRNPLGANGELLSGDGDSSFGAGPSAAVNHGGSFTEPRLGMPNVPLGLNGPGSKPSNLAAADFLESVARFLRAGSIVFLAFAPGPAQPTEPEPTPAPELRAVVPHDSDESDERDWGVRP